MCLRRCGEAAAVSLSVAQKKTIRATAGELPTAPHFSERWRTTNGAARKKWPQAFEYAAALRPSDHPAESRAHASTKSAGNGFLQRAPATTSFARTTAPRPAPGTQRVASAKHRSCSAVVIPSAAKTSST
ncbi:hypothetical protein TcCL_Unassigned02722 [Trypanosoma cruzi]|nr:hypothetical protein TcCL_Unassigned02722 [Trypanosoma cruzi]